MRSLLRRCWFLLLTVLLVSCTTNPTVPPAPIATVALAATATPANTPPPSATPAPTATPAGLVVRLKNVNLGTYIYEAEGKIKVGTPPADDPSSHWLIEDYQGSKRIRNTASGNYLAIEHEKGYVETIPVEAVWMSPRWSFDTDPSKGVTLIRNVWHNWEVLYTLANSDIVQHGRPPLDKTVSQWALEALDGTPLAAPTATAVVAVPTALQSTSVIGATVPWTEYEAEAGTTNGTLLGPDRTFGTIPSEASGRQAVQLTKAGSFVQITTTAPANSIVVRYVIPDAPKGGGLEATLSLYVNGVFRQKLDLTSKYAWSYGGESAAFNAPGGGGAHHFFDEARALVADIPAGATLKLQKDSGDTAEYYVIDLLDLEQVAPPLTMPASGFLSLTTDCGAVPDDSADDGPAFQKCLDQAKAQHKGVWIPVGTFDSTTVPLEVSDETVQGAGMWYSVVHGQFARFNCNGNNCRYADFAILGETVDRNDDIPENGFNNGAGTGSSLNNIWVEHTKVGYWVGPGPTNGLIISNSRFRDLFADGVNFAAGTSNSVVQNSHFRNTGDDALASWSLLGAGPVNTNNVFRFNTVQIPWRANCFAIYGGQDNKIENNLCADTVLYPGILIAQSFNSTPFAGVTSLLRNTILRAGGNMYHQEHGAVKLRAEQGPLAQVVIQDLTITDSTFSGIEIDGSYPVAQASFENVTITGSGTWGIVIRSSAAGQASFKNVSVSGSAKEGLLNYAPAKFFTLQDLGRNSGW